MVGSSQAPGTSNVHLADYNGPFHGWTKTDGGAGSAIHPLRQDSQCWRGGVEGVWRGGSSRQIQKQVGVARAALTISAQSPIPKPSGLKI